MNRIVIKVSLAKDGGRFVVRKRETSRHNGLSASTGLSNGSSQPVFHAILTLSPELIAAADFDGKMIASLNERLNVPFSVDE